MKTQNKPTRLFLGLFLITQIKTYRLRLGSFFVTQKKARKKASHSHSLNNTKSAFFGLNFIDSFGLSFSRPSRKVKLWS